MDARAAAEMRRHFPLSLSLSRSTFRNVLRISLLLLSFISLARADFTIVQKIEGGLNSGQMTLRIKDDKARADLAAQVSTITDLASGETITLQHAAKVFIKIPAEQAQKLFERVQKQQQAVNAETPKL